MFNINRPQQPNSKLVRGTLAVIGPEIAFVRIPDQDQDDVLISGTAHRSGSTNGDQVVVELLDETNWTPKLEFYWEELAAVLGITSLGTAFHKKDLVNLVNQRHRTNIQLGFVETQTLPQKWMQILLACNWIGLQQYRPYLKRSGKVVQITKKNEEPAKLWNRNMSVVPNDDINAWTKAILLQNNTQDTDLDILRKLERNDLGFSSTDGHREDLTSTVVFTVDPPTSEDLDDAVSCKRLKNGNFEVVVHIADVSHFVRDGTLLDESARARGSSIYLQDNKAVHMLPHAVVEQCSLVPGEERFAVSIKYEMTDGGKIINASDFFKSVIRCCAKLSYQQAQDVINGDYNDMKWDFGKRKLGNDERMAIVESIRYLNAITQAHRVTRLHRDQAVNLGSCKPVNLYRFDLKIDGTIVMSEEEDRCYQSQEMIEELAILTNQTAAEAIIKKFSNHALLCQHPEPLCDAMHLVKKNCRLLGLDVDTNSRASIRQLLERKDGESRSAAIRAMLIKTMRSGQYIQSGETDCSHYALGMTHYTTATSPIRRYADIVVHRMLFSDVPIPGLEKIIDTCNNRETSASNCKNESWNLYMGFYLKQQGPLYEEAVVVGIYPAEFAVDILVLRFALRKRIWVGNGARFKDKSIVHCVHRLDGASGKQTFCIYWQSGTNKTIAVWDEVNVKLEAAEERDPRNIKVTLMDR